MVWEGEGGLKYCKKGRRYEGKGADMGWKGEGKERKGKGREKKIKIPFVIIKKRAFAEGRSM